MLVKREINNLLPDTVKVFVFENGRMFASTEIPGDLEGLDFVLEAPEDFGTEGNTFAKYTGSTGSVLLSFVTGGDDGEVSGFWITSTGSAADGSFFYPTEFPLNPSGWVDYRDFSPYEWDTVLFEDDSGFYNIEDMAMVDDLLIVHAYKDGFPQEYLCAIRDGVIVWEEGGFFGAVIDGEYSYYLRQNDNTTLTLGRIGNRTGTMTEHEIYTAENNTLEVTVGTRVVVTENYLYVVINDYEEFMD